MAYDSIYDRNREFALRRSTEGLEIIADYFDLPFDEDADYSEYHDQYDTVYATLYRVWGEAKNNYSNYIRSFFRRVNDRFGTKFPS